VIVAAAVSGQGAGLSLSLAGDGADVAWHTPVNGSGAWAGPPSPRASAAVAVQGFGALCEVTLLAAAATPSTPLDDACLLRSTAAWAATIGPASAAASAVAAAAAAAAAAIDADPRSCVDVLPADAPLRVALGALHSISAVHLLPSAPAANVSVAVLPFAGADASNAVPCGGLVDFEPWRVAVVECGRDVEGEELLVEVNPSDAGTPVAPSVFSVCDVAVRGRPG